jgi:hypothetical protein
MRKAIFISAAALLVAMAALPEEAHAQQSYTYSTTRTRTLLIDWQPERNDYRRYTVSVSPLLLMSNGLKFDFEFELPEAGNWLGTGLAVYIAPQRRHGYYGGNYWSYDGNERAWFNSGWDLYNRMWGVGTSAFYKNTFSHRGWYFSAGMEFEFFRVGVTQNTYIPYEDAGLTFYDYGRERVTKSYFKPTAQINIGKHMAISERCYFDLYAGLGISYAFIKNDGRHEYGYDDYDGWYHHRFTEMGGFAYRGLTPVGGFRFGVLLWKPRASVGD